MYNRVSSFPLGADGSSEEDLRLDGALKIPCCTHLCSLCPTGFNGIGPREPVWLVGLRKVQKVPDWSFSLSPVERCPAGETWAWQDYSAEFPCWMCCLQYCRKWVGTPVSSQRFVLSWGRVCLAAKNLRGSTLAQLTPSTLPLHDTQSRLLCSAQLPGCSLAKLGGPQQAPC